MIIYTKEQKTIKKKILSQDQNIPNNTVWIDLINISSEEEQKLEQYFKIDIPNYQETKNIFVSNRLYEKQDAIFMTITLYISENNDVCRLSAHNITFIIIKNVLITIHDFDSNLFDNLIDYVEPKHISSSNPSFSLFLILLEKLINNTSAFLENIGHHLDRQNDNILHSSSNKQSKKLSSKILLKDITNIGNSVSKNRESLISFNRTLTFISQLESLNKNKGFISHITIFLKDIEALSNHATFLSSKINFLLDATLGLINIQQNNIIKIFSLVSVIFMPPTLIASIYGMNFDIIPELKWAGGYPLALIMMLISSWIPYKYFKKKNWL